MLIGARGKNIEYWSRAETGPICFEDDFDKKIYWPAVKNAVKKYEINYTPDQMVPVDDEMLDRVWEAALDVFVEVGVYCIDTRRRVLFTRDEVLECMENIGDTYTVGTGIDQITVGHRGFEDYDHVKNPPFVRGRILGPISPDLYQPIAMSYVQVPYLDMCDFQGNLTVIYGMDIKPGSPWEALSELWMVAQIKDVCRQCCRPGLSDLGIRSLSLNAQMSTGNVAWGTTSGDVRTAQVLPHFKVEYSQLCRAIYWHNSNVPLWEGMSTYIGGLSGSPATSLVTSVAEYFTIQLMYNSQVMGTWAMDGQYFTNTSKYALWCSNFTNACINRKVNCPAMAGGGWQMTHGIGSEEFFWESAASAISATVLGGGVVGGTGCQSAGLDQCSGLGLKFSAEVGKAVAKARLTREHANDLVKQIMQKYQPNIDNRTAHTIGGNFRDCYDLRTVQPTKEYLAIYNKVKKELTGLGLSMNI